MMYQTLDLQQILARFENLRQAPTGDGKRMPHKPLLILLMLGRIQRGNLEPVRFDQLRPELEEMLSRFGPPSRPNALDPFWRLQNDDEGGLWEVRDSLGGRVAESITPPGIRELEDCRATGNFPSEILEAFRAHPLYVSALSAQLLADHFPQSLHDDIAAAAGLELAGETASARADSVSLARDPGFRARILTAYEYRCALTGWDLRIGYVSAGFEAAHIRWHVAGGPSNESNGLALNSLHHKLFDLGAFTLSVDDAVPKILVSRDAHGGDSVAEMLMRFHKRPIRAPLDPAFLPDPDFIRWHQREVFKGTARV